MALFYFNDTASGAANNANLSDPLNWWMDAGWTIPAGELPGIPDDVVIDSIVSQDSMGIGAVGFNSLTLDSNALIVESVTINTSSFTNNSTITEGYNGVHYTNGIADSYTGLDYDYYYGAYCLYTNGMSGGPFTGGYDFAYYTAGVFDPTFLGFAPDYGYDPTGNTPWFFVNGSAYNGTFLYGGSYWQFPPTEPASPDWGLDFFTDFGVTPPIVRLCFYNVYSGGYGGQHYSYGLPDNFTGFDTDPSDDTLPVYFYSNGTRVSGVINYDAGMSCGYNGSYYSWQVNGPDPTFTGFASDYGYDPSGTVAFLFVGGQNLGALWNGAGFSVPIVLPSAAQVQSGVTYYIGYYSQTGTLVASSGSSSPSALNLGQLIGLPSFIQL